MNLYGEALVAGMARERAVPLPKVPLYRVWVYRCVVCDMQVRDQHPNLTTDSCSATTDRLGRWVIAGRVQGLPCGGGYSEIFFDDMLESDDCLCIKLDAGPAS